MPSIQTTAPHASSAITRASPSTRASAYGFAALLLWSMTVAFVRSVTEAFGALGGVAMAFSVAAVLLAVKSGIALPRRDRITPLLLGGFFFVAHNILLSQAIARALNNQQTLEIGLINYLWPSFIVLLTVPVLKLKPRWYLYPGLMLSYAGVIWCVCGGNLDVTVFWANIIASPVPYILALLASLCWGFYSLHVRLYGAGPNDIMFFFTVIAAFCWGAFCFSDETLRFTGLLPIANLAILACIHAFSFSLWEKGVSRGNITLLATCAYFLPIMMTLFTSFWLAAYPPYTFWYGVMLVVVGSLICWKATKNA